jgi:hypothetical protein
MVPEVAVIFQVGVGNDEGPAHMSEPRIRGKWIEQMVVAFLEPTKAGGEKQASRRLLSKTPH